MKCKEMSVDEHGTKWKRISLTWYELAKIEEAIELAKRMSTIQDDEITLAVGKRLAIRRKKDGIAIAFEDWDEPKPIDMPEFSEPKVGGKSTTKIKEGGPDFSE